MTPWRIGLALTRAMTVNELASKLNLDALDKPNLRAALNSAVRSGLATKHKRRVAGRLQWIYKWRM